MIAATTQTKAASGNRGGFFVPGRNNRDSSSLDAFDKKHLNHERVALTPHA
jgi:hypothetical protein